MASLTETAYYTRKGINFLTVGVIAFVILKILWAIGTGIWNTIFPPPPPPATVSFGKLPAVNFSPAVLASASAEYTFSLQTIGGGLPVYNPNIKVYFLPLPGTSFGDFDKMKTQAARMGFTGTPVTLSGETNTWRFDDPTNPLRHLEYSATSANFHLYYDFIADLGLFSSKSFGSREQIISAATTYLTNLGLFRGDLAAGYQGVTYFKLDTNHLVPTTSLVDADAVNVNFYRQPVKDDKDLFPIVSADPNRSLVSVMFSGSSDDSKKILEIKYYFSPIDRQNFSTYPVITPAAALAALRSGGAYVTSLVTAADAAKTIIIRKVYLAYLDPFPPQNYLQPVYVFSSETGFVAYVQAVVPQWTEQ